MNRSQTIAGVDAAPAYQPPARPAPRRRELGYAQDHVRAARATFVSLQHTLGDLVPSGSPVRAYLAEARARLDEVDQLARRIDDELDAASRATGRRP